MVEDARALKPGMLHLVDRVLKVYAPTALTLAAVAGWLFLPAMFGMAGDAERALFAGLTVLVMGYPCALGISAPLSIVRGAGEAAERGILMRTGEAFQGFRLATHVVFDKTGTLTVGKPALREIEASGVSEAELLRVAAAAEAVSEHPLARAVLNAALERGIAPAELEGFEAVPGRGVRARLAGENILVGNLRFLQEDGVALGTIEYRATEPENLGRTVIFVARGVRVLGLLAFGDVLRPGAADTVAAFRRAGLRTLLLSGDNIAASRRIASEVGVDETHAGMLPQEKVALIRKLQQAGNVAMVGDGINDAPALMQANIGIAMGGGTDIAIDSADIIILNNRLEALLEAREVSRWSYRKMVQNVCLACCIGCEAGGWKADQKRRFGTSPMARTCTTACFRDGDACVRGSGAPAEFPAFLRFNLEGRPVGKAAPANLFADAGAEVWGVLYMITRHQLVHLDATEGARYHHVLADAKDGDERPLRAVSYIAAGKETDGNPSLRYLMLLREGARAHGLPRHWIAFLEKIEHAR